MLFAGLGLTNHEALTAVTARPAAACGLAHRKARLEPGFDADLLVVDGDPNVDITALLRPVQVVRAGRPVKLRPDDSVAGVKLAPGVPAGDSVGVVPVP